jgi:hypothetical protein
MGFESGLPQTGVVKSDHGGSGGRELYEDGSAHRLKEVFNIHPIMTVEPVIGCPVMELTSGCAQKSGYGVAAETDQVTEQMTPDALGRGRSVCVS